MTNHFRLCSFRLPALLFLLLLVLILVFLLLNDVPINSHKLYRTGVQTKREFTFSKYLYNITKHGKHEVDDLFNFTNIEDCTVINFLRRPDKSIDLLDRKLFCDEKAQNSDVICRWFFSQIGVPENSDVNTCLLTGSGTRVPKIVYYVIFGYYDFEFWHYVSVVSAKRYINPSGIYVIGDAHPVGEWWKQVLRDVQGVRFIYRESPPRINGQSVKWKHHLSDLVRLQVLYANGGIYLDTDMVVTRPLDPLLEYDISLGLLDIGSGMGNAIILAKRGSKFVHEWYDHYNKYNNSEFFEISLHVPRDIWQRNKSSVHMESNRFYSPNWFEADKLFKFNNYSWHDNYAVHVWTNGNKLPRSYKDINKLNTTLGQIFRNILYGSPEFKLD